jgi:hypothetical protein
MHRPGKTTKSPRGRVLKHPFPGAEKCPTTNDYPYGGDDVVRSGSLSCVAVPPLRSAARTVTSSSSYIVRTTAGVGARFCATQCFDTR